MNIPLSWKLGAVAGQDEVPAEADPIAMSFVGYCFDDGECHWFEVPNSTPLREIVEVFEVGNLDNSPDETTGKEINRRFANILAEIASLSACRIRYVRPEACILTFDQRVNDDLLDELEQVFELDDPYDAGLIDYIADDNARLLGRLKTEGEMHFRWEY